MILIHHGALGDFLTVWPGALALSRDSQGRSLYWAGAGDRLQWLEPLGFSPCPAALRKVLDRLHGADAWPQELEGSLTLWFVLDRVPEVPESACCHFLKALPTQESGAADGQEPRDLHPGISTRQGMDTSLARITRGNDREPYRAVPFFGVPGKSRHVRDEYARGLANLGIPAVSGWLGEFRRLFAAQRKPGRQVLLFPGAGHPGKQWPLVQYFRLADMIRTKGLEPLFVLGPAELERGLIPEGLPFIAPDNMHALSSLILTAKAVVGADTGPMHLAGMLGVPGVSLFGPTDSSVWGPVGMREVNLGLDCSPCTTTCADLVCPEQRCMRDIPAERVMMELEEAFAKCETGFQDPGILESRFRQKEEE
ncbi:MAG: glycosyl transferase family [Desulfovibrionaceae bacterium]|nr:MAG: glycosyl transferase family [Desulfovibrionaceae bacterium]